MVLAAPIETPDRISSGLNSEVRRTPSTEFPRKKQRRQLLDPESHGDRAALLRVAEKPATRRYDCSELLGRAKAFLPSMQKANEGLQEQESAGPGGSLDIEQLQDASGPHIEMDLACGVLDLKDREAACAAARSAATCPESAIQSDSSSSSAAISSEDDTADVLHSSCKPDQTAPCKTSKRKLILEL